jgi:hypothetical protein
MRKNTIVPLTCEHCSNCLPRYSVFLFQPCNKLPSWDSNFWSSFFLHRTAPTEPNPSRLKIQRQAGRQNSRKSQQSLRIHPVHRANSNIARPLSVPALGRIGMVQRQSPFQNRRRRACSCALPVATWRGRSPSPSPDSRYAHRERPWYILTQSIMLPTPGGI